MALDTAGLCVLAERNRRECSEPVDKQAATIGHGQSIDQFGGSVVDITEILGVFHAEQGSGVDGFVQLDSRAGDIDDQLFDLGRRLGFIHATMID